MNVVTVKINGVEYNLKGDENEEYLHRVALNVDKKIKSILEYNAKLSTASAAVLTAVNAVDEMYKKNSMNEELIKEQKNWEEKERKHLEQMELLKQNLESMENHISELQKEVENDNKEIIIKQHEETTKKLNEELELVHETARRHMEENNRLRAENKEMKFELQSSKYKIMNLQHKLIENQMDVAKIKKQTNPLLK